MHCMLQQLQLLAWQGLPVRMVPVLGCGPEPVAAGGGAAAAAEPGLGVKLLVLMPISAAAADVSCRRQADTQHIMLPA
jgi:hypothetical protein